MPSFYIFMKRYFLFIAKPEAINNEIWMNLQKKNVKNKTLEGTVIVISTSKRPMHDLQWYP